MMELNAKSPFIWDWENLVMFSSKTVEAPKKQQLVDSELDAMEEGFEAASFYSSGGGGGKSDVGSGGSASASDLGYGSSSKSSKSAASIDSSTNKEMRESMLRLDATNNYSFKDPNSRRGVANPWESKISSTTRSGESLICLKLGRTYSEDVSVGGGDNCNTVASVPVHPPDNVLVTGKRSKISSLSTEIPRCQVEGCGLDLSSAKDYHRKHRVCEAHSKSPRVVVAGIERRFCQQCSRFHNLSEFDQKKRSCRRRLSDHNARRRKPKPEVIQFNPMRLPSSLYEGRQQIAFNQVPMVQPRTDAASSDWDFSAASKVPPTRLGLFDTIKTGGNNELHLTSNEPHNYGGTKHLHHSTQLLPCKGVSSDVFSEGLQVSATPPNLDATQNLRALSLLSTHSWGSCELSPGSLNQPMLSNNHQTRVSQPLPSMHPPVSSAYWQNDQHAPAAATSGLNASTSHKTGANNNNHFQDFQLFKAPTEPNFYLY